MSSEGLSDQLLKCLFHVIGRAVVSDDHLREIVGDRPKQIRAFNLCDGTRSLTDIAKTARVDQGNLSRTAKRWVEHGLVFWVGNGTDARLLHIYPLNSRRKRRSSARKMSVRNRA